MESKVDPHAMRANIKKCLAGGKTGPWVGPVIRSVEGQMHPAGGGAQLKVATAPDLRGTHRKKYPPGVQETPLAIVSWKGPARIVRDKFLKFWSYLYLSNNQLR